MIMKIEEFEQKCTGEMPELLIEIRIKQKGYPVVTGFTTGEDDDDTWDRVHDYVDGLSEILEHNREAVSERAEACENEDRQERLGLV